MTQPIKENGCNSNESTPEFVALLTINPVKESPVRMDGTAANSTGFCTRLSKKLGKQASATGSGQGYQTSLCTMSSSKIFLLQSMVVWCLLCLPGNLVTLILYHKINSAQEMTEEAEFEVSKNSSKNFPCAPIFLTLGGRDGVSI